MLSRWCASLPIEAHKTDKQGHTEMENLSPADRGKKAAAVKACEQVESDMRVGLGTGSTAAFMVRRLAERVDEEGLRLTCVATSTRTAELARSLGLTVQTLNDVRWLDLTIDGADEFDGELNLIKGGGGALLQEKIVATASDRMVVITDPTKDVDRLGAFALPVEVIPFGWQTTRALISELLLSMDVSGREISVRQDGNQPFVTDEGNMILDLHLQRIGNVRQMGLVLNQIPGVVENGLFTDICSEVIIGHEDGTTEVRTFDGPRESAMPSLSENLFASIVE